MAVQSGDCYRCKRSGLLYAARTKDGTKVGLCYECREFIRNLKRQAKA